jgi:hypothetical protein
MPPGEWANQCRGLCICGYLRHQDVIQRGHGANPSPEAESSFDTTVSNVLKQKQARITVPAID